MTNYCNPILTWGRGLGQDQEGINRGLKRSSDQHKVKQVSFKFVTARCGDLGKPFTWKKKKTVTFSENCRLPGAATGFSFARTSSACERGAF